MNKTDLRKYIRSIRTKMSREEAEVKSRAIFDRLKELGHRFFGSSVFIYVSFDNEADTNPIIEYFLSNDLIVSVPVVVPDVRIDAVRIGSPHCNMKKGCLGIYEPEEGDVIACKDISSAIIPGIAFDRNLNRIGFGKGYYDDFLVKTNARKIALAYDFQIVESIGADEWDVPMDVIITDKEIIYPKGKKEEVHNRL